MTTVLKIKDSVACKYCAHQGLYVLAQRLRGEDAVAKASNVTRYGCSNGHKFAVPTREVFL